MSAAQLLVRVQYSSCATRARRHDDFKATAACLSLQARCLCVSAGLPKLLIARQQFVALCHWGDPVRGGAAPRFADLCTARRRTSDLKHRVPEVDGRPHGCGTLERGKVRLAGAFSLAGL